MAPDALRVIQWFAGYNPPPKKKHNNRPRQVAQVSSDEIEARVLTDDANEMDYAVIRYPRHGSRARRNGGRASGSRAASAPPLVPIAAAPEASPNPPQTVAAAPAPAAPVVAPAIIPVAAPAAVPTVAVAPIAAAPTPAPAPAPVTETKKEAPPASVAGSKHSSRSERMAKAMRISTHPECDCANCGMGRFLLAEYDLEPRGTKRHDGVSDKQPAKKDAKPDQPKEKANQDKQDDGKQNQGQKQKAKKGDQENKKDDQGNKKSDSTEDKQKAEAAQKKTDKPSESKPAETPAQPQLPVPAPGLLPELPEGQFWVFDPATRAYFPKVFGPAKAEAKAETSDKGKGKEKSDNKEAEKKTAEKERPAEKQKPTEKAEDKQSPPPAKTPEAPLGLQFHLHASPNNAYDLPAILEREAARLRSGRSTAVTEYEDLINRARFRDFVIRTYGEEAWEREEERHVAFMKKEGKKKESRDPKVNNQEWASKSKEYEEAHPSSTSLSGSTIGVGSKPSGEKTKQGSQSGDTPSAEWPSDGGDSNSKKGDEPSNEWPTDGNGSNDKTGDNVFGWGPDTGDSNDKSGGATWGPSQDLNPQVPNPPTENDKDKIWIDPTVSVPGAWGSWGPPSQISSNHSTIGSASHHTQIWTDISKLTTAPSSPTNDSIPNESLSLVSTIRSRCTNWVRSRSRADLTVDTSGNENWVDPTMSKQDQNQTDTSPKDKNIWPDPTSPKGDVTSPKGSKTSKDSKMDIWIDRTSPKSPKTPDTPKGSGPTSPKHVSWANIQNDNNDKKEQDPETWSITATVNPSTPTPETKGAKPTSTSRPDLSGFGSRWK